MDGSEDDPRGGKGVKILLYVDAVPGNEGGGLNGLAWEFMGRATLHLCTVRVPMHTVE